MALTHALVVQTKIADRYVRLIKTTWDSSYATGGEACTPADLGFADLPGDLLVCDVGAVGAQVVGVKAQYDPAAQTLIALGADGAAAAVAAYAQIASGVNLSTVVSLLAVFGKKPVAS